MPILNSNIIFYLSIVESKKERRETTLPTFIGKETPIRIHGIDIDLYK